MANKKAVQLASEVEINKRNTDKKKSMHKTTTKNLKKSKYDKLRTCSRPKKSKFREKVRNALYRFKLLDLILFYFMNSHLRMQLEGREKNDNEMCFYVYITFEILKA